MEKLIAPADKSWVAVLARDVKQGDIVGVDDEHVDGLVAQGWTRPKTRKTDKPAAPAAEED